MFTLDKARNCKSSCPFTTGCNSDNFKTLKKLEGKERPTTVKTL